MLILTCILLIVEYMNIAAGCFMHGKLLHLLLHVVRWVKRLVEAKLCCEKVDVVVVVLSVLKNAPSWR